ncbi:putative Retroviral aspartyl protease [Tenacibaculum litopenaei]|uniref:aspartyl protease family protein n=1 Tax=Tenacibaculum litopenaei TaxID=396016 RepID=UPI003893FE40
MQKTKLVIAVFLYCHGIVAQVASLPMKMTKDGHTFIRVAVDNSKPLHFVFDTGATADVLDSIAAQKLGVKSNFEQAVQGASGSEVYHMATGHTLNYASGVTLDDTTFVLKDMSNLNQAFGVQIDGITGYSLLNKYVTKLDYEQSRLTLYKTIEAVDLTGFKKVKFKFSEGIPIPLVPVEFTLSSGLTFNGDVLFDSGAGMTLLVNSPFAKSHKLAKKAGRSLVKKSEGLGNEMTSEKIRIHSLKFGPYAFEAMPIALSHSEAGVTAMKGFMGIVGAKIIQRFTIVLDYKNQYMYLKPNSWYSKAFDFPLSGISLRKKEGKIMVNYVDLQAPVYKKGLRKGFEIVAINDDDSRNLVAYELLLRKEGSEVLIEYINEAQERKKIKVRLVKLL